MKTCSNPNCNATGIPDEAKFCPVCGQPMPSGEQLKKQKKKERQQLRREAELAWDAYPNKPLPKKNPYSILWKVFLVIGIIVGDIMFYLGEDTYRFNNTFQGSIPVVAIGFIIVIVYFMVKASGFNNAEEVKMYDAEEKFIEKYIKDHME